ncbi:MAG TPA: extracellular solute-binding protein, partial [Conexibacter sp.]|nr:extracellular solute-binding protein [Conexibacter sp.]
NQAAVDFENANPGVKVEVRKTPFAQYEQRLRMQLGASQAPDVARLVLGYGNAVTALALADKGLLSRLDGQPWVREIPPSAAFTTNVGDSTYALPVESTAVGALYDASVLRAAGVEPPATFAEVLELCRATTGDTVAYALGAQQGSEMPAFAGFALAASTVYAQDPDFGQQRLDDTVTFAGSAWVDALDRFQRMHDGGCFGEDAVGTSQDAASAAVAQGRALFAIVPTVTLPLFQGANPQARFAMAPFAGSDDASDLRVPASPVAGLAVPSRAKQPRLAEAFLDFYAENRARYNALDDSIPAMPTAGEPTRLPGWAAALAPYFDDDRTTVIADAQWPNPEVRARYGTGLAQLLLGDKSGRAVLESMDDAWTSAPPK